MGSFRGLESITFRRSLAPHPGCASPVLAVGGAHLLSVPRSRAEPVGAAQSDRVPGMASRRLVASALIRPIVKLPFCSLRRRHLYPCRLPSSPFTDQLLPTIQAIVASSPSLLRVALVTAASRGDPSIHDLATVGAERHRRISTPMIHIGTQTPRHQPLSPLQ